MAAKIKKGDKVVVLAGRDKGRSGEVMEVMPTEESGARPGHQHGEASHQAEPDGAGRHHLEGSPHPPVEPGGGRPEDPASRFASASRRSMTAARFALPRSSGELIDG